MRIIASLEKSLSDFSNGFRIASLFEMNHFTRSAKAKIGKLIFLRPILAMILSWPLTLLAQSFPEFTVELGGGYEYNVFNAPPTQLTADSSRFGALRSGAFQYTDLRVDWDNEWENSELKFGLRGQFNYFPGLSEANLMRPGADLSYRYHLDKKSSLYTEVRYRNYQTDRGADPNEVFIIPRAYRTWEGLAGYAIRPAKNTWLQFEVHARNKRFAASSNRQLQYNRLGVRAELKQRFRKKGQPSSYFYATLDLNRRVYQQEDFTLEDLLEEEPLEGEEDENLGERLWRYQQLDLRYKFQKWGDVQLETGLGFLNRSDILQERLGYRQVRAFTKLKYGQGPWKLTWTTSYTYRPYTELAALAGEEELLLHQYLRTSLTGSYSFKEDWLVMLRTSTVKRWRNQSEKASNFLPYFNSVVRVGIQRKF